MNTSKINLILTELCSQFLGVFSANYLPSINQNGLVILNTDESNKPGVHWVAMYLNNDMCEFFDSFGKSPEHYHNYWHDYLVSRSGKYIYNDDILQKLKSNDCGKFCIFHVAMRHNGVTFASIIEMLDYVV